MPKNSSIRSGVSIEHRLVTDGRTQTQTDTGSRLVYTADALTRGKNWKRETNGNSSSRSQQRGSVTAMSCGFRSCIFSVSIPIICQCTGHSAVPFMLFPPSVSGYLSYTNVTVLSSASSVFVSCMPLRHPCASSVYRVRLKISAWFEPLQLFTGAMQFYLWSCVCPSVSVASRCSVGTGGRIDLVLARMLLSVSPTPCFEEVQVSIKIRVFPRLSGTFS